MKHFTTIQAHITSGRISERESSTAGVWEYMDNGNIERSKIIKKQKEVQRKQEIIQDPSGEVQDDFDCLFDGSILGLTDASFSTLGQGAWDEGTKVKGKGKGNMDDGIKITYLGKGRGKGKKGKGSPDPPPTPEDPSADGIAKPKQAHLE